MKSKSLPVLLAVTFLIWFPSQGLLGQEMSDEKKVELVRQASQQLQTGEYQQATESLKKLATAFPDRFNYHFSLADAYFMNGQPKESVAAYDRALEIRPDMAPRCWQRGLALYYAGEFELGKKQFEIHRTVNTQDVENSVWHMLCHTKVANLETARSEMIPISGDRRVPMSQVFEMFAGTGSVQNVLDAAQDSSHTEQERTTFTYYAHLYIGLYQEMTGEDDQAMESMRSAAKINPLPKGTVMGAVADMHLKLRSEEKAKE